jgi:hypothetical protein
MNQFQPDRIARVDGVDAVKKAAGKNPDIFSKIRTMNPALL